ncbi:zinc-ribbon domain-containing protein [Solidesulfovibrio carbinolicus]|uniref:Uncharacterized protein n=1 Tax=Solidesulfovibrio carbinolicus TaxID=296842 RepID=A0A4P6HYR1_9BACT|nr:zinc-ribbon domain-containing protein [Solidesulfovibrio carbinolicus]QAZ66489.1 hypothetical protein C3Y92_04220 [Solidesulfovibrio carbinolicus]
MAGFMMLVKLLTGAAAGGAGMGSGLGRMAGQGLAKGLMGSAARGLAGGKGGMGGGKGRGQSGGQGGGQGRCGCGQGGGQGETSEQLVKIVELVAKRLAERNAGQSAPALAAEEQPALETSPPTTLSLQAAQPENVVETIEVRAVAMAAYACRMCGRRISVAADDPIADPRCPQCGGPMDAAPEA